MRAGANAKAVAVSEFGLASVLDIASHVRNRGISLLLEGHNVPIT